MAAARATPPPHPLVIPQVPQLPIKTATVDEADSELSEIYAKKDTVFETLMVVHKIKKAEEMIEANGGNLSSGSSISPKEVSVALADQYVIQAMKCLNSVSSNNEMLSSAIVYVKMALRYMGDE